MALDQAALARFGEQMRAKKQLDGVSGKQISWITDGYNLGYLTAEEAKARFGQLIEEEEDRRNGEA